MAPRKMVNAVKKARGADGRIDWGALTAACGTTLAEIGKMEGRENAICVKYACGQCENPNCKMDHCCHWDCPGAWQQATLPKLKSGVDKLLQEEAAADAGGDRG